MGTDVQTSSLGVMKVTFSDSHEGMLGLAGSGENPHLSKASGEQGLIGWNREWELMARGGRGFCLLGHVSLWALPGGLSLHLLSPSSLSQHGP